MDETKNVLSSDLPKADNTTLKNRFPYSAILANISIELSDMPVLEPPEHSVFVQRVQGWKSIRTPKKSLESKIQKDCVLCNSGEETHSKIWHAYGAEKDLTAAVRIAQDAGLMDITPSKLQNHMRNHNYQQPSPDKRLKAEEAIHLTEELNSRDKNMLVVTYRQRVLLSRQLADLFFVPVSKNDTSAQKSSYKYLHNLRFSHFLYQYKPNSKKRPEVYYFLGKNAAPWVEQNEGRLVGSPFISSHEDINDYLIDHDVKAADIFVQLRKQLYTNRDPYNFQRVFGEKLALTMDIEAWHGARSLSFIYSDPLKGKDVRIIPDGFATLSIEGDIKSQLPFFYEWDSGSKNVEETVQQIENYVGFAMSGVANKRFPILQTGGSNYCPPIVWVTSTPNRAYNLHKLAQEGLSRFGKEIVPLMIITDYKTLCESAYKDNAWYVIHPKNTKGKNFPELIVEGNHQLLERNGISPKVPIEIKPDAARPKTGKGGK